MRYGCTLCDYETQETGKAGQRLIRAHVRSAHDAKLGFSKGGELPIRRIATYPGEVGEVKRPKTKTILDQIAEKLKKKQEREAMA